MTRFYIYIYIIIIYIIYIFINISLFLSRPIQFLLEFWQILPKNMFIEKRGWCVLPSYIPHFFLGTTPFLPVCNAMAFCFWGLPCPRVASAVQRQRPGRRLYHRFFGSNGASNREMSWGVFNKWFVFAIYRGYDFFTPSITARWWQLKYVFMFIPKIGEMIQLDEHIFSDGLKPPTRWMLMKRGLMNVWMLKTCGWTWGFTHVDRCWYFWWSKGNGWKIYNIHIYIFIYIYIYICIYIEAFLSLFSIPWITKWLRLFHFLFACISLFWTTYFLFTLCVNCIFLCTSGWQSTWILRVVGFRCLCGQKLLLFLESTLLSKRASGMEAAFFCLQ